MKLNINLKPLEKQSYKTLLVLVPNSSKQMKALTKELNKVSKSLVLNLQTLINSKMLKKTFGSIRTVMIDGKKVIYLATGIKTHLNDEEFRKLGAKVSLTLKRSESTNCDVFIPSVLLKTDKSEQCLAEGMVLGAYEFKQFKTEPVKKSIKVRLNCPKKIKSANIKKGALLGESTNYARDLGNIPANFFGPKEAVIEAKKLLGTSHLKVTILERDKMQKLGMNMLLGVAMGSVKKPRLIILNYTHPKAKKRLALVGKGVTFDSGGISLKPGGGMDEMKFDMCGAAAVLATFKALKKLKPVLNVIGAVPVVENMPGSNAQRPGDIVKAYNGKTVEVLNTDAEGRLILGDALSYVCDKYKPDAVVDVATLTGAALVALGHYATGLVSNNNKLSNQVLKSASNSGERTWRLPAYEEYARMLKGKYADLKNIGGRTAGTITAGLFLSNFVYKTPWAHLDIAGTAWNVSGIDYIPNSGATGVGTRLFLDLIENFK